MTNAKTRIKKFEKGLYADRWAPDGTPSALYRSLFGEGGNVDQWVGSRWEAPSVISVDSGATAVGASREDGTEFRVAHLLTPETEVSCHYFWNGARNFRIGDTQLTTEIGTALQDIFNREDKWILEGQEQMMGGQEFWQLSPGLLGIDEAVATARRMLGDLIAQQQPEAAKQPAN